MATDGWACLPAFRRTASRKAACTRFHVPFRRQRRKLEYTVCQGGYSCGNCRHWQPVLFTYSTASRVSRTGRRRGRPSLRMGLGQKRAALRQHRPLPISQVARVHVSPPSRTSYTRQTDPPAVSASFEDSFLEITQLLDGLHWKFFKTLKTGPYTLNEQVILQQASVPIGKSVQVVQLNKSLLIQCIRK